MSLAMNNQFKSRVAQPWHSVRFWQEMFVYFWVFSLAGHYLEVIWTKFPISMGWKPVMVTITPIAAPYGFGAVAVVLLVWPLIKKRVINPLTTFILCILISGLVEFICAASIVLFVGHNQFWNYSHQPINLLGYTCLESSLVLGAMSTLFLYFIYPFCEKMMRRINNWQLNAIFWILLISYSVDLVVSVLLKPNLH
jgi:uncharacterized membrane protein